MRLPLWFLMPSWVYGPAVGNRLALRPFALDCAAIGGLVGSAPAFLPMLAEMLSPDAGVLSAESKRDMLTGQAGGAAGIVSQSGVGLGWKRGEGFWNHEGGGPGFCSETRLHPRDDLGVVVLLNLSQSAALSRVCDGICECIREGVR